MLKNIVKLEVKVNDKDYQLLCDHDSPTIAVKAALDEFMKIVEQIEENEIKARENAKNKDEEVVDITENELEVK